MNKKASKSLDAHPKAGKKTSSASADAVLMTNGAMAATANGAGGGSGDASDLLVPAGLITARQEAAEESLSGSQP